MNELSKNLKCILMRSGVEIWAEEEKIANLKTILERLKESKFIDIENQFINSADISGIFDAELMADRTRRKNGQFQDEDGDWHNRGEWKCGFNSWHERNDNCGHTNKYGYKS